MTDALNVGRSEEHTSELQSLMRTSYAVFGVEKKKTQQGNGTHENDKLRDEQLSTNYHQRDIPDSYDTKRISSQHTQAAMTSPIHEQKTHTGSIRSQETLSYLTSI